MTEATVSDLPTIDEAVLDVADEEVFVFPTSFGQQRLWFLDQFEPGSPFYNIPSAVRLTGSLDVTALEQALNEIVRRHESLRTTFTSIDGQPMQVIAPGLTLPLPVIDLEGLPESEREAEALRLAAEEARRPFDLMRGPLLRARLLRLGPENHIALFTMHHIISDGWSIGVFIGEVAALYAAFSSGLPSPLPDLAIQYADFSSWQREWLQGEVLEEQIVYWKRQLGGELPILELPTDRPRPAVQTLRGATQSLRLPGSLSQALGALSRREGCTLFMTLMAAFQTLLYRYTGQEDICVGAPIANRSRAELEPLIGLFINTLVIRTDLSGEPTFRELLQRVRQVTLDAYARQDLPFEQLVEVLQPDRDMSHSTLFQVMFILQNAPATAQELPGLTLSMIDVDSGTATFDLTFSLSETADGLDASVEYNIDLFDDSTIARMLGHFRTLLAGIVAGPDQSISTLPLLIQAERHQLLVEWNNTAAHYTLERCIHQLFEAQVEQTPDAIAVVWQDSRLTYQELNRRANQLAHYLRKLGVGPETVVGICVERSLEMMVSVLGVLKAGGAYLPLDPLYPQERLSFMLQDSAVPVLLTQAYLSDFLSCTLPASGASCKIICVDTDWNIVARECDENPINCTTPENLAYLIYTSGSTGKSKGVMIEQRSLVSAYLAWEGDYRLRSVRSHLQMANFAFDVFSGDWTRALCSGGKLVLCPRELLLAPHQLYELMRREQVDCAEFVPAVLRHLIQYLKQSNQRLDFMRLLICGSDSWYVGEYKEFLHVCGPQTRLINSFGLTEATIDSSYFESGTLDLAADQVVPIGRPFPNTQLYILDKHLQPTPIGVPGELCVGGVGVARGYLNRPDLTADKFIPASPYIPRGGLVYKTGDLARFLPDANIEFLGRLDHQLKVRGYRIEPGEIEAVLGQYPGVREAVVMARESERGDQRLVAYIEPQREPAPTPSELRRFVQERLPDYMTPSTYVVMGELPLTPNGKIDRLALPAPDWSRRELEGECVAPCTPIQEALVSIWADVLGDTQIGIHDNFFELGGHSLLATQVVSRVRDVFGVELPLRNIFESPTVAMLAEQIEVARRAEAGVLAPPIRPVPRDGPLPLSFAQQRLWFLDQLEPDSPFYNLPETMRLTGSLNVAVLEQCLNEIVRRHEILRTTFSTGDGRPFQVIAPQLNLPLPVMDLRHLPQTEREAEAWKYVDHEAQKPFNLAQGPLLRAGLLRLDDEDHIVLLTMHHIIGDEWSTNVLSQEIMALYQAFSAGQPSPLLELPIQYADFSSWQREWLQGEVLETQLAYWRQQLGGSPPLLELPTDRPRPPVQTFRGAYQTFTLNESLSRAIRALCQQEGATLFMTLLAAFQVLLHRYTGCDDINVGTPIANRNRAEIEGLIGFFVNTLVLRANFTSAPTFRELLKQVREMALGAYAHQDVPFELIVDALKPERNLSHSPLFQVMFVIQNAPARAQLVADLTSSPVEAHSGTAKFDLTLFMLEETDGQLSGALEYNTDLFDAATIARMVGHFRTLLEGIVADPDRRVSALPLLTEAERHQLLVEWNDTAADYPHDQCIHQLFEAQVERTPDATAVVFGEQRLSYRELNRRTNQLAHHLQKLGVGPETLVGVCIERSLEMVVGLLGILKAGGAYVPLDPTYPPERLSFMLQDSNAPVLLTQSRLLESLSRILHLASCRVIRLDADWAMIAQENDENPSSAATPENLAYMIYTSGSTGKPKGAMIVHRGLVNYLTWCRRAYPLEEGQGAPVHSSISFDLTITGLFGPLLVGRKVMLVSEDQGVETLGEVLRQESNLCLVKITPAHLELVGQQLAPREAAGRTRAFIIGGENLMAEHIAFWQAHAPDTLLVNEYGPTETVVGCCVYFTPNGKHASGVIPIGRPIINTQLYVLDRHMQPLPIGVPGELYIGGAGVARGYLNRPELTAERFICDPFRDEPGARIYKTGDLVRYLPDGDLECLGRIDNQVKIRGFRVELGEIEAVLCEHPAVRDVAVLAREDDSGVKRLVAYVVPTDEELVTMDKEAALARHPSPFVNELRTFLKERLPEHMLPSALVVMGALPLTPNGKVDRRALPPPDQARPELEAAYVVPATRAEEILAGIWAQVLGVERVGIHDNFFELGGDSIMSIQVIARANQAGLRLTPRQLFEHPTVAGLAAVADTGRAIHAEQGIVMGPVPLTPIQRWFFEQDQPDPHHFNQTVLLKVQEPLERSALETAIGHLLKHHDALRLRFGQTEAGWQAMHAGLEGPAPFEWIDLATLPESELAQTIETRAAELQASLDISEGPLMRVAYFDLGAGRPGRLLMIVHHVIVDGVSWRILLEDLLTAFQQIAQGKAVQLPLKTTSFQYWARRLTEYAQSETVSQESGHWSSIMRYGKARLPLDHVAGEWANTEASARSVTVSLEAEETHAILQELPAVYHTEINDALLTALAQAFAKWTGMNMLLVDMEGHGREDMFDDVDISRTVGWFTTIYPVLLDLGGAQKPGEALKVIKEQVRRTPNHGIGYGLLRHLSEDRQIVEQLRRLPQAEVSFNYLGQVDRVLPASTRFGPALESSGPDRSLRGRRTHLLDINGGIAGGRLQMEWTYSENLHRRETIEKLARDFIEELRSLIAHCQSPEAGGYTVSDFAEFGWGQQDLEDILTEIGKSG